MSDEPPRLVFVNGMTEDRLCAWAEQVRAAFWRGSIILPAGYECQIIELSPHRIEPDIEDEP